MNNLIAANEVRIAPAILKPDFLHRIRKGLRQFANGRDGLRQLPICSIKGNVKKKISPVAGFFLAFQPARLNMICSGPPFRELGLLRTMA
jgi:hypothetical protein